MPYKSQAQAAYMHIHHPDIAARWDAEYGGKKKRKKVKKSFIPGQGYVKAVEAGAPALRAAAGPRRKAGWQPRHYKMPLHERGMKTFMNPANKGLSELKGLPTEASRHKKVRFAADFPKGDRERVLSALPKKVKRPLTVHNNEKYFPGQAGMTISRTAKRGQTHMMVGTKAEPAVVRHEYEHTVPKRRYGRNAELQKNPTKLGQEEGRADARMIRARGSKEPIASDYELQSILNQRANAGNRRAAEVFDKVGGDVNMTRGYDRIRQKKLGVPNRGYEAMPQGPQVDYIKAGDPKVNRFFGRRKKVKKSFAPGHPLADAAGWISHSKLTKPQMRTLAHKGPENAKARRAWFERDSIDAKQEERLNLAHQKHHWGGKKEAYKPPLERGFKGTVLRKREPSHFTTGKLRLKSQKAPVNRADMHPNFMDQNTAGYMTRTGSKSRGQSNVVIRAHDNAAETAKTLKHELAHAGPKRSSYRLRQIGQNPEKAAREEARADWQAGTKWHDIPREGQGDTAYQVAARNPDKRHHLLTRGGKEMNRKGLYTPQATKAYREVQNKMTRAAARKKEIGKAFNISKFVDPEKRLRGQKKASAYTSVVGGTLGLSALGALAMKKKPIATNLGIMGSGVGGVGAYNYASIQNQEAKKLAYKKKRRKPVVKAAKRDLLTDKQEKKVKTGAAAVGGTAAAAVGVKYGTGAYALRAAKANPRQLAKLGRKMQHDDRGRRLITPKEQLGQRFNLNTVERKLNHGINHWEDASGVSLQRKIRANPNSKLLKLHPRYAEHKILQGAVAAAPKSHTKLYRGVTMKPEDAAQLKKGQTLDKGIEAWSDNKQKAHLFAHNRLKYNKADADKVRVSYKMKKGAKALNIQGRANFNMSEWLQEHPYKITRVKQTKKGNYRVKVKQQIGKNFNYGGTMDLGLDSVHQGQSVLISKAIPGVGLLSRGANAAKATKAGQSFQGATWMPKKSTFTSQKPLNQGGAIKTTTRTSAVKNPFFTRSAGKTVQTGTNPAKVKKAPGFQLTKLGQGTVAGTAVTTAGAGGYMANRNVRKDYEEIAKFGLPKIGFRAARHGSGGYAPRHGVRGAEHTPKHAAPAAGRHRAAEPTVGRHRAPRTMGRPLNEAFRSQPSASPFAQAAPAGGPAVATAAAPAAAAAPAKIASSKKAGKVKAVKVKAGSTPPQTGMSRRRAGAYGGGAAVVAAGGGYAAGHNKDAIRDQYRSVRKAFNPEDKRKRRADIGATGLAVGAGAGAYGAGVYGNRAQKNLRRARTSFRVGEDKAVQHKIATRATQVTDSLHGTKTKDQISASRTGWKGLASTPSGNKELLRGKKQLIKGGKQTAVAAAIGLGATGAAVGAHRVRNYQGGKGGTYRPLHRITS